MEHDIEILKALDCLLREVEGQQSADTTFSQRCARALLARWRNKGGGGEQLAVSDEELLSLSRERSKQVTKQVAEQFPAISFLKSGTADEDFVLTEKLCQNLLLLDVLTVKGEPVLLQGPICSGKTSLLTLYAKICGRADSIRFTRLQLHDQMDGKGLIGNYVIGEEPGQFLWQPGPLTEAVRRGYWLLLEDLDAASADALSVIVHLAEFRNIQLPNCHRPLQPHPNFRLFATLRTSKSMHADAHLKHALISNHVWSVIELEPLDYDNIKLIINKQIPTSSFGEDLSKKLLEIFHTVSSFGMASHLSENSSSNAGTTLSTSTLCRLAARKQMTLRDFVKFVRRVESFLGTSSPDDPAVAHRIWLEAIDVFSAHMPDPAERLELCARLGILFSISRENAEQVLNNYKALVENHPSIRHFKVGRMSLPYFPGADQLQVGVTSYTRHFANLLERVCCAVSHAEPILLVGETGCGKTYLVQHLARSTGHMLRVANMSQQTDATDLLGGYRPIDFKLMFQPLKENFESLFGETFSLSANSAFLSHLQSAFASRQWQTFSGLIERVATSALSSKGRLSGDLSNRWKVFNEEFQEMCEKHRAMMANGSLPFSFVEGLLVKAVREGFWLLLDEINLAPQETLDSLAGLMEGSKAKTLTLYERGTLDIIPIHPDFRLFACMNPATDVGKKPLPDSLRARFSEVFVPDPSELADLRLMIEDYLSPLIRSPAVSPEVINRVAEFYLSIRRMAKEGQLTDGSGGIPHFSIRTLCRGLILAAKDPLGNHLRSLAECLLLSFLTQLNSDSLNLVTKEVLIAVYGSMEVANREIHKSPTKFKVPHGGLETKERSDFIITDTVLKNIEMLSRVVSLSNYPVLLQGETAVGKTSTVQYIADLSGNRCIRLNNHEHTDLSEYVGSYTADAVSGQLVFRDGPLVSAMRKGYWVILDELNLAPGEVLEALNRVLDDNREIVIPETQEVVQAHPRFRIFATQNPPGAYAGRKMLSRAFRNRFIEMHFCELPDSELETLVSKRCKLPPSHARRLVAVMRDLAVRRRRSGIFAGRQGFMTLRDLFRWARRYSSAEAANTMVKNYDWNQHLADHGYLLLAGQARNPEDEQTVIDVLQKHFRCKLEPDTRLFSFSDSATSPTVKGLVEKLVTIAKTSPEFGHLVFTRSLRRMAVLLTSSFEFGEPVLLVGDTGCGKTTLCQLIAIANSMSLITLNCHLHTEAGDFIGSLRPAPTEDAMDTNKRMLFIWQDGPLTKAMQIGAAFLVDEISLADDSVLERLNSVLDADDKSLLIPEKAGPGSTDMVVVHAHSNFRIIATMNPGGDFGKRELSPALRNRFTEIYCPAIENCEELAAIAEFSLNTGKCGLENASTKVLAMAKLLVGMKDTYNRRATVRDLLAWTGFVTNTKQMNCLKHKLKHGAMKAIGDGLPLNSQRLLEVDLEQLVADQSCTCVEAEENKFGVKPFYIDQGPYDVVKAAYCFDSPTTRDNLFRLLRALSCDVDVAGVTYCRPILLEGPPGVGKTSLVSSLAAVTGHRLVRINLSEQTDLADLFGAHLPQENGGFAWVDGPLLRAFKSGDWVLVDELNLASQPVLEGLNACLDHRRCASIPELGIEVGVHQDCRFFGAQNPSLAGGGRKNLPRSFLNRFTQVFVDQLTDADYEVILCRLFPSFDAATISLMVRFNSATNSRFGKSSLLFNLRDLTRWCELLDTSNCSNGGAINPGFYVHVIYASRFAKPADQQKVHDAYFDVFVDEERYPLYVPTGNLSFGSDFVSFGLSRLQLSSLSPLHGQRNDVRNYAIHGWLPAIECMTACSNKGWMVILYGEELSGKTSIVRYLARIAGRALTVLAVTPSLDATDLLGSYEQVGWQSQARSLLDEIFSLTVGRLAVNLIDSRDRRLNEKLISLYDKCRALLSSNELLSASDKDRHVLIQSLHELLRCLEAFQTDKEFLSFIEKLKSVISLADGRHFHVQQQQTPSFVWSDSVLVSAMRRGDWLLVDNANFCSPAVLDRLNSLFEPGGTLYVHERGCTSTKDAMVVPHPDFRIFLTANPKFGELSRAVRNRGIEIYLPPKPCLVSSCWMMHDLNTIAMSRGLNDPSFIQLAKNIYNALAEEHRYSMAAKIFADLCTKLSAIEGVSLEDRSTYALAENVVASCLLPVWRVLSQQQKEVLQLKIKAAVEENVNKTGNIPKIMAISKFCHWKLFNILHDRMLLTLDDEKSALNFHKNLVFMSRFRGGDVALRSMMMKTDLAGDWKLWKRVATLFIGEGDFLIAGGGGGGGSECADLFWSSYLLSWLSNERRELVEKTSRRLFLSARIVAYRGVFQDAIEEAKQNALWNLKSRLPANQHTVVIDVVNYCSKLLNWLASLLATANSNNWRIVDNWTSVHYAMLVIAACRYLLNLLCQPIPAEWLTKLGVIYRILMKNVEKMINVSCGGRGGEVVAIKAVEASEVVCSLLGGEALSLRKAALNMLNAFGTGAPYREECLYSNVCEIDALIKQNSLVVTDTQKRNEIFQSLLASDLESLRKCFQREAASSAGGDPCLFALMSVISSSTEVEQANALMLDSSNDAVKRFGEMAVTWDWLNLETATKLFTLSNHSNKGSNLVNGLSALFSRWSTINSQSMSLESVPWMATSLESCTKTALPLPFYLVALLSSSSVVSLRHVAHWQRLTATFKDFTWSNISSLKMSDSSERELLENILRRFIQSLLPRSATGPPAQSLDLKSIAAFSPVMANLMESAPFRKLYEQLNVVTNNTESSGSAAAAYLTTAAFMFSVFTAFIDSDPADVVATRQAVIDHEAVDSRDELEAFNQQYIAATGHSIDALVALSQEPFLHPRSVYLMERIPTLVKKSAALRERLAFRPSSLPFEEVAQFLVRVRESLLSADVIARILADQTNLKSLSTTSASLKAACREINRMSLAYPDLLTPVQFTINMANYGLSLLLAECIQKSAVSASTKADRILSNIMPHFLNVPSQLNCHDVFRTIENVGSNLKQIDRSLSVNMLCCYLQLFSEYPGRTSKFVRPGLLLTFEKLLSVWREVNEERRAKATANENLYRYRIQTHCDEPVTDEEKDEADVARLFPSYDDAFELVEDSMLCDIDEDPVKKEAAKMAAEQAAKKASTEVEYDVIDCPLVFDVLGQCFFQQSCPSLSTMSASDRFFNLLFGLFFNKNFTLSSKTGHEFERDCLMAGCLFANRRQRLKNQQYLGYNLSDFYFGLNSCDDLFASTTDHLVAMRRKLLKLLSDWPEHPQLAAILRVVDVVLDMPATSTPPAKILAGFERVYEESQVWEQSAGKANSLNPELGAIIATILEGRRRQLDAWSKLLDGVAKDAHDQACSSLLKFADVIFEQCAVDEEISSESFTKFTEACAAFMEACQIGEFATRLQVVRILSQLASLMSEECIDDVKKANAIRIANILANVVFFFSHYEDVVTNYIKDSRKPIEAELKEFVKISRWNDANFWRVRTAVHQAHKKLARARRLFAEVLVTPISRVMTSDRLLPKPDFDPSKTDSLDSLNESRDIPNPDMFANCDEKAVEEFSLQNPSLPARPHLLRVAYGRCIEATSLPLDANAAVNNLSSQILQAFTELSSVSCGERKDDEAKYERNVKALQQRKLRALTDLFHKLTDIGVSYRTGLAVGTKSLTHNALNLPLLEPALQSCCENVDLSQLLSKADRKWWRLVGRFHLVDRLVANPHEIVGPRVVERARGSVAEFCQKLYQQREKIVTCVEYCAALVNLSKAVYGTTECSDDFNSTTLIVINVTLLVRSLKDWLQAAPSKETLLISFQTNDSMDLTRLALDTHSLDSIESNLKFVLDGITRWQKQSALLQGTYPPEASHKAVLSKIEEIFTELEKLLNGLSGTSGFDKFSSSLQTIRSQFASIESSNSTTVVLPAGEQRGNCSFVSEWLIVEQKLAKFATFFGTEAKTLSEDDADSITKITTLHSNFEAELSSLRSKSDKLFAVHNSPTMAEMARPFITYSSLIAFEILRRIVQLHLSELRLANIVTGLFASLLANGLCLPSLAKGKEKLDMKGDGACELVDIEDGGFGEDEGEGSKDVSKKIESADQVEDLQKDRQPGDEKDDEDFVAPDDEAIEMPDDLDSKVQDDKKPDKDEKDKNEEDAGDGNDLDKKMGDAGSEADEDVDVEFWQGENEEEEEESKDQKKESDKKTSKGEKQTAPELGASDSRNKKSETGIPDPGDLDDEEEDPNRPVGSPPPSDDKRKEGQDDLADMAEDLCLDENEKDGGEELPGEGEDANEMNEDEMEINLDNVDKDQKGDDDKDGEDDNDQAGDDDQVEERKIGEKEQEPGKETDQPTDVEQKDVDAISVAEEEEEEEKAEAERGDKPSEDTPVSKMDEKKKDAAASSGRVEFTDSKNQLDTSQPNQAEQDEMQQDGDDNDPGAKDMQTKPVANDDGSSGKWAKPTDVLEEGEKNKQAQQRRRKRRSQPQQQLPQKQLTDDAKRNAADEAKRLKTVDVKANQQPDEEDSERNNSAADAYARMEEETADDEKKRETALGDAENDDEQSSRQPKDKSEDEKENEKSTKDEDWWQSSSDESSGDEKNDKDDKDMLVGEEVSKSKQRRLRDKRNRNKNEQYADKDGDDVELDEDAELVPTSAADRPPENRAFTNINAAYSEEAEAAAMEIDLGGISGEAESDEVPQPATVDPEAEIMWTEARQHTEPLAAQLCERLRAILEPSVNSKFKGDFRSGKRLNVRRLVAYAASGGRRDRIWLRRCEPGRRRHRVLLAVDDSHSMSDCSLRRMAVETLSLLAGAFSLLEIGELAVCSFGETTRVLQPFADPFLSVGHSGGSVGGAQLVSQMKFNQPKTGIAAMIAEVGRLFLKARLTGRAAGHGSNTPAAELLIILTDGRGVFSEGQSQVRRAIRFMTQELTIFPLVLVLDNPALPDSIFDIRVPVFSSPAKSKTASSTTASTSKPTSSVQIVPYLDQFPFPFYVVVRDLNQLPEIVADALAQWIDMVQNKKAE